MWPRTNEEAGGHMETRDNVEANVTLTSCDQAEGCIYKRAASWTKILTYQD